MSKKLHVGNLPFSMTEDSLREMFATAGEVSSVNIIMDRYSGQPRGFAFVEMAEDAAAVQAINEINGKMVDDRTITVAEARARTGNGDRR
jgi:RNA recognition motif-containing protein